MSTVQQPKPVHQLTITAAHKESRLIYFVCVPDVHSAIEAAEVGRLKEGPIWPELVLFVNPLYDFDEVLAWIKSLG